jgi:hypothetical protein
MKQATATKYNQACAGERRSDRLTQLIKSKGVRIGRHKGMHTHIDEEIAPLQKNSMSANGHSLRQEQFGCLSCSSSDYFGAAKMARGQPEKD